MSKKTLSILLVIIISVLLLATIDILLQETLFRNSDYTVWQAMIMGGLFGWFLTIGKRIIAKINSKTKDR